MKVLDGVLTLFDSLNSPELGVHPERCVLVRNKHASCLRCAEVCASGAITFTEADGLTIAPDLCIGCGTCATACPTCALEALHPTDEHLAVEIQRLATENTPESPHPLFVSCARATKRARDKVLSESKHSVFKKAEADYDPSGFVQVACLGRLDESFYTQAAVHGFHEVDLICASCDTCRYHKGGELALDVRASALGLLDAHGFAMDINILEDMPDEALRMSAPKSSLEYDESRRSVLTFAHHTAQDSLQAALELTPETEEVPLGRRLRVQENGALPQFLPTRRNRVFNSITYLGKPMYQTMKTRLWGQVAIDTDLCNSCRMCATFCPTGALAKFDQEDGTIGVDHRSYLCVQCTMCQSICPKEAITVHNEVSLADFEEGVVQHIPMKPLDWTPNKPDSMVKKMAKFIPKGKNISWY